MMSKEEDVIYLTWAPPIEPESSFKERLRKMPGGDYVSYECTEEECYAHQAAINSAKFWYKRMPLIIKVLSWRWSQYLMHALHREIEYISTELIIDSIPYHINHTDKGILITTTKDKEEILMNSTKTKYLAWFWARYIRKNVDNDDVATRRLFSVSISIHSLAHTIKAYVMHIQSMIKSNDSIDEPPNDQIISIGQRISSAISLSLKDPSINVGTIVELLRLVSINFNKYSGAELKHHPYNLHTNKLNNLRLTLIEILSDALERFKNDNPVDIIEGAEYCLHTLLPKMWKIYHNIQMLIITFERDGYYSRLVATQIVQSFPKGSNERPLVTTKLRQEGRIPSEKSMRTQLQWCETQLDCCEMGKPIINQRWSIKRGRKRKSKAKDCWIGTLIMDVHPIEMIKCKHGHACFREELMIPIITMDLFSPAKRVVDLCNYIGERKNVRLYFCPKQFPVPFDTDVAWDTVHFKRLRWFIEYSSMQGDSHVKYSGKEKGRARFRCTHSRKGCPFSFVVKVDLYGYYIDVYNDENETFLGCEFHEQHS